jgi:hypothetical protein
MIHTIEVDLAEDGVIIPRTGVGVVLAQPFLDLNPQEPFICKAESKQRHLDAVIATLEVARAAKHGADRTHFTIFPECSIPGPEGIAAVDVAVEAENWKTGTVVIGGVDGLTSTQFKALAQAPRTYLDNEHNNVNRLQDHEWVNCSITWVKFPDGTVKRWLQPKIAPAWVERNVRYQSMFRGRSVFIFKGQFDNAASWYRFCSLLCFDWVADIDGKRVWQWVADGLGRVANAAQTDISLSWLIVAQCNPQPSHHSFLTQVDNFFDQTIQPNVLRDKASLIMANTAGSINPGRVNQFGSSSVVHSAQVFAKPDCSPTYGNGGMLQRASNQLGQLRDALFREGGACIHSFFLNNPAAQVSGAAGKNYAISSTSVHPFIGTADPRLPSALVPASTKWINDDLDDNNRSLAEKHPGVTLATAAAGAHATSVGAMRVIGASAVDGAIRIACPTSGKTADDWGTTESKALDHMLQTLAVLNVAKTQPVVHGQPTHATITLGDTTMEMVAIRADTHEACDKHLKNHPPLHRRPLLVVSRDEDNTDWPRRLRSILDTGSERSDELNITDPTSALRHIGYRTILDAFRSAENQDQLNGELNGAFSD